MLVVDDELPLRLLYRFNLEAAGLIVIEAGDGPTGLESAKRSRPDLILLDVMMPVLDGWMVAEELRRDPATREIPFVFATPRVDVRDRLRGFELGAIDYITLPCDPTRLPSRIRALLALTRDECEARRQESISELKKNA